ncbi:uncharacterized protein [Triticum aestivum]|uniref:uncharacterized protein isoform X2 n=1 Tax=Triticum aestivum TaxID=4565 RepID=UPI001D016B15|nr:uncharacterized protein LOC123190251 isoform X2 [Triticum aestivum]
MGAFARPPGLLPPPPSSSPRLTYCDRDAVGSSVAGPRPSPLLPLTVHVAPTSSPDCPASTREATEAGIGSASLCIVFSRQPQVDELDMPFLNVYLDYLWAPNFWKGVL